MRLVVVVASIAGCAGIDVRWQGCKTRPPRPPGLHAAAHEHRSDGNGGLTLRMARVRPSVAIPRRRS